MYNEKLLNLFKDCRFEQGKIYTNESIPKILDLLNSDYSYDILKEIIGVDNQDGGTELIYHLYSTVNEEDLFISKTVFNETETVTDIFPSAIADENEIYDMFGVKFIENQTLKRLYMPDSWEGFPLRKDYIQSDERLAWNDDNNA